MDDEVFVYTPSAELIKIKGALSQSGFEIVEADLIRVPITTIVITDKQHGERINRFLDALENLDDVQKVYSNMQETYE